MEINLEQEIKRVKDEILSAVTGVKEKFETEIKLKNASEAEVKTALEAARKEIDELMSIVKRPGGGRGYDSPEVKTAIDFVRESFESKDHGSIGNMRERWVAGNRALIKMDGSFHDHRYVKTTISSSAVGSSTPGILVPERVGGLIVTSDRIPRVRDLLARATTQNNVVEWVKVNAFTNNASYQVEASDKAESALTFTIDYAPVRTLAHWIPATRQVLSDWPQLQGYIDNRLMYGLKYKEDVELLFGDGLGSHMTGLCTDATAYAGTYAAAGDTKIDVVNNALAELEAAEYMADGIIINPVDWRKIQKIKEEQGGTNKGAYIMGGPRTTGAPNIWDTPIVKTTAMPVGSFLVGNFQIAAQIFDREGAQIDISTEHSDFFVKNLVAIRAEERLALVVYVPGAMRYGTY